MEFRFRENFVSIQAILYTSCLALRKLFNPDHVFSTVTQTHNIYLSVIKNCVQSAYGNSEEFVYACVSVHTWMCMHVLNVLYVHVCAYIHVICACGSYAHIVCAGMDVCTCLCVMHACCICAHTRVYVYILPSVYFHHIFHHILV